MKNFKDLLKNKKAVVSILSVVVILVLCVG